MIGWPLCAACGADAELHRRGDADGVAEVRTNRAVLIGAVHDLAGTEAAQLAAHEARDPVAAGRDRRLFLRQLAAIQEIAELLRDHRRVHGVAVAEAGLVVLEVLILEALARRGDLGDPRVMRHRRHRVGQRFQRRELAADDAELDRQVPADVFVRLIDADVLRVRPERELADGRHAVLADQDAPGRRWRARRARRWPTADWRPRTGPSWRRTRRPGSAPSRRRASTHPTPSRRTRRCSTR